MDTGRKNDLDRIRNTGVTLLDNSWASCGGIVLGGLTSAVVLEYRRYKNAHPQSPGRYPKPAPEESDARMKRIKEPDLSWLDAYTNSPGCHILLCHHPEYYPRIPDSIDWILSAHAHGGQWRFDHLDHKWIIRFVESRIKDPNIIHLIWVMLKAEIMKDFVYEETEEGSGQGSVCSPILANIYMHYVLVWWFKERIQPKARGFCGLVVYADDFVVCFQYKDEAETFYKMLGDRMERFGLTLEKEKSRLIEFGRFAEDNRRNRGGGKPETFTFLGFTHYCSHGRNGQFRVKRKTSKKKFNKKVKEMDKLIRDMTVVWGMPIKETIIKLNQILVGYYHYYGITDNSMMLRVFRHKVEDLLYMWLNRRSQKKSIIWQGFQDLLKVFPLKKPHICYSIYGDF